MTINLTFGSLFAGIGGFDLGFERAGMTCKWQVEIDDYCNKVLAKHWPDVRRYKDVKKCGSNNLEPVDVIAGGFPCQDISTAYHGKRAGLAGERSGLWFEFQRIIDELVPTWVVIENNPPLLKSSDGRDFTTIVSGLVDFGYGVCWRILDAKDFGAGSTRRRLYVIAKLSDVRSSSEVLFESNEVGTILSQRKEKSNTFPMCVGWDGGLSYERLRQCVVTQTDPIGAGKSYGVSKRLDKYRYRTLGNAVVPAVAEWIGRRIVEVQNA